MRNKVAGSNGKVAIKVDTAALSPIFGETGSSRKHCNPFQSRQLHVDWNLWSSEATWSVEGHAARASKPSLILDLTNLLYTILIGLTVVQRGLPIHSD